REELISILKIERPLFEANLIEQGSTQLTYLKWNECDDGTGEYGVDWEAAADAGLNSEMQEYLHEDAPSVTSCLMTWVQCAKAKAIPDGYFLMPSQPNEEMLAVAKSEFGDDDIDDLEDKIVFAHQGMIKVACQSLK
ncbi:TPA: hypothetical protein OV554_003693, partial [Acinetobacter baumannii]|nr:hypothetical protein [Acinetobacter baumannii]